MTRVSTYSPQKQLYCVNTVVTLKCCYGEALHNVSVAPVSVYIADKDVLAYDEYGSPAVWTVECVCRV